MKQKITTIAPFLEKIRNSNVSLSTSLIFVFILSIITTYLLAAPHFKNNEFNYKIGEIASHDVIVKRDIFYENIQTLLHYKQEAMQNQRYIFDRSYSSFTKVVHTIQLELSLLSQSFNSNNLPITKDLFKQYNLNVLTKNNIHIFKETIVSPLVDTWAVTYATFIFDNIGIIEGEIPILFNFENVGGEVYSINSNNPETIIWKQDQFLSNLNSNLEQEIKKRFDQSNLLKNNNIPKFIKEILSKRIIELYVVNPYIKYNVEKTKRMKEEAANKVFIKKSLIQKGTLIVREGDPIDSVTYEKLKVIYNDQKSFYLSYSFGIFIIQLLLSLGIVLYIYLYKPTFKYPTSHLYIFTSLILIYILYSYILFNYNQEKHLYYFLAFLPTGFIGIMATILVSANIALFVGIYLSCWTLFLSGNELSFIITFVGVISGMYSTMKIDKRGDIKIPTLIISITVFLSLIAYYFISNVEINILTLAIFAVINGFFSTIFSFSLLPIYENIFNLPTKFKLLELSDTTNTLIQKIITETPSTYTHTLMVANLSERAVSKIGGNTLLTKVGCLYHDIGKTIEPLFFSENRHLEVKNKFKNISSEKATQTIISHVTEGIKIAKQYNLPQEVIDFIPEHHGTTTIQYFYHKALKEQENKVIKKIIDKKKFQYGGPKPQSKETAIVMMADSIDATSRSLDNPTLENLKEMIDRVIQTKIDEDQFDECQLTLKEIKLIKESFLETLINSFHLRPKYPKNKNIKKLEQKVNEA